MKKNDKRFIKCENLIRHGLLDLMKTKKYQEITINQLCEYISISKNTFYAHYLNKDELLNALVLQQIDNVFSIQKNKIIPADSNCSDYLKNVYSRYFEYIQNNSDVLIILFSRDEEINFSMKIAYWYKKYYIQLLDAAHSTKHIDSKKILMIDYYISGGINFIKNWLLYHQNSISILDAQNILWNLSSETNRFIDND